MKKYIDVIIAVVVFIILAIVGLTCIKSKYVHYINFNNQIYLSTDKQTFSFENEVITYKEQDNQVIVTTNFDTTKTVYDKDLNMIILDTGTRILNITIEDGTCQYTTDSYEDFLLMSKYAPIVDAHSKTNDKINITLQKVIGVVLAALAVASGVIILDPKYAKKCKIMPMVMCSAVFAISAVLYFVILLA